MKKLCALILPLFLGITLSSCAWVYQVTGVEGAALTEETTQRQPVETVPDKLNVEKQAPYQESTLREGCYSNGSYIMELTRVNGGEEKYHLIIYTPQYGLQMFVGSVPGDTPLSSSFTVADDEDPQIYITVTPSADCQVLSTTFRVNTREAATLSGAYKYFDPEKEEQEELSETVVISAGEYTYKGYQMTIAYEPEMMRICIESPFGETLFYETKETKAPVHSAIFEEEWGSVILVPVRDGSGGIVVSGRSVSDRTLQYAGTYTLT